MRKGSTVPATTRAERSRATTAGVMGRELLYGAILSRFWPAYLAPADPPNDTYPLVLCVESPAGRLTWRLSEDEMLPFESLTRKTQSVKAEDRTPTLLEIVALPHENSFK